MTSLRPEQTPDETPALDARHNGSRAEMYNLDVLTSPSGPSSATLLEEGNFPKDSAVQRVIVKSKSRNVNGQRGITYRAEIDIKPVHDDDWLSFLEYIQDPDNEFTAITDVVELEEDVQVRGKYRLFVSGEALATIEFNPFVPHASIHTEPDEDVVLAPTGTEEADTSLSFFMSALTRTLDLVGGLESENPLEYQHNRVYRLGYNGIVEDKKRPKALTGSTTRAAIAAAIPEFHHPSELVADKELSLDDVGGHHELRKKLRDIGLLYQHPEAAEKWGVTKPPGIFIAGPPGVGKTLLVEAFASELGAKLHQLSGSDVYEKWIGMSEANFVKKIDELEQAKELTVFFLDELETLISAGGSTNERLAVLGAFKRRVPLKNPKVLTIACTNDEDKIEPALIRPGRFTKFYVGMPTETDRAEITNIMIRNKDDPDEYAKFASGEVASYEPPFHIFGADIDASAVGHLTDGFSGAALQELFDNLKLLKFTQEVSGEQPHGITQKEVEAEIRAMRSRGQVSPE